MNFQADTFKAPDFSYSDIQNQVIHFKNKYKISKEIPVDIEKIVEFQLGIDIVPIPNLRGVYDVESWLATDFTVIYIDKGIYDRYLNRYRFSLAHEIGHLCLHNEVYKNFNFNSTEQWKTLIEEFPTREYASIEYQAYSFAGLFLVPKKQLSKEFDLAINTLEDQGYSTNDFQKSTLLEFISRRIAEKFQVSQRVVEKRLEFDDLIKSL